MATDAEVEEFATHHRGLLYRIARDNLSADTQRYADDVVAETLLSIWAQRKSIRNLYWYACVTARTLAINWRYVKSELRRNVHLVSLDAADWGARVNSGAGGACMTLPDIQDTRLDPEAEFLERAEEEEREKRRACIISQLTEAWQANYREWEARNFHSYTHGEACKASRLRKLICELSGVPYTGHARRIHVTHAKPSNRRTTEERKREILAAYDPREKGSREKVAQRFHISVSHLSRPANS